MTSPTLDAALAPSRTQARRTGRAARTALTSAVLAAVTGTLLLSPAQAATTVIRASDMAPTVMTQTKALVSSLEERSGPNDPRYLEDGVFVDGSPDCMRCTIGPAAFFAAYGVRSGDTAAVGKAVQVIDRAIADHQRKDGAFAQGGTEEAGSPIQTALAGNVVAETYLILGDRLDDAHRTRWKASIAGSADFLIKNGNVTWYTNGNINLANTMNLDLAARITGEERFTKAAADSLQFTLSPPQARWKGFGLQITKQPTKTTGSDGAGYLAESGVGGVGYDPAYTLFQANIASTWFVLTGSPDALRLTNLLYNQLEARVRLSDWTVDVSGGTRRPTEGVRYRFSSSSLPVLAKRGSRPSAVAKLPSQLVAILEEYRSASGIVSPGMSYNFAVELTPALLVLTDAPPATGVKAG